jgi:uncharacterized RDD family membrane protein YckC
MIKYQKLYLIVAVLILLICLYNLALFLYNISRVPIYFSFSNTRLLANYLPLLLGIPGSIIFLSSGFKRSGLLGLFMCIQIASFPFWLLYQASYFNMTSRFAYFRPNTQLLIIANLVIGLLMAVCCVLGLWLIRKEKMAKLSYLEIGQERKGHFVPASGSLRLANRVIDAAVIAFIFISRILPLLQITHHDRFEGLWDAYLFELPVTILYYLLFESIFNTTGGKCATNTVIVNAWGNRPNFGQHLGRTICRFIPFEAFSFLGPGARGWHDTITATYVVNSMNRSDTANHEITFDAENKTN